MEWVEKLLLMGVLGSAAGTHLPSTPLMHSMLLLVHSMLPCLPCPADPSYMIRSIPTITTDRIYCKASLTCLLFCCKVAAVI